MDDVRARLGTVLVGSLILAVATVGAATTTAAAAKSEVAIRKVRYSPQDVTIRRGDSITWVHQDGGLPHNVVADDGSFDSNPTCGHSSGACMKAGDRYTRAFTQPGTVSYYCRLHGAPGGQGMAGTVRVVP